MQGKFFRKPDPSMGDRVPPGQHLTNGFPIMTYGSTPDIDLATWEFKIWGLAEPKTLDWEAIQALPSHEFTADFHCVTRWSKLDVTWRGFKVKDLLALLDIDPAAQHVMQHCYGGYTTNIALEDLDREDNFFAYELDGEPLPPEHGGPLRLVVPHLYAWKSAKWINGLEFLSREELGFWERNGYHSHGEPFAEERYSNSF